MPRLTCIAVLGAAFGAIPAQPPPGAAPNPTPSATSESHGQRADQWTGKWTAELKSPGGPLRFGLEIAAKGSDLAATIVNRPERIAVPAVRIEGEQLVLEFPHYDSRIRMKSDGPDSTELIGRWQKDRGSQAKTVMPFRATRAREPASGEAASGEAATALPPRWRVQFEKDEHPSVGQFQVTAAGLATGTFATTLGDYRFLSGTCRDGHLELSCFDGAHAFLFRARLESREAQAPKLAGHFWSSDSWHETWTAEPDDAAELPDAWQLTSTGATTDLGGLAFPDANGKVRRLDDPAFTGPARLLVVFGSWCPNCHDEFAYLVELDRKYRDRGLRIQGLAFEHAAQGQSPGTRGQEQVRHFAARHGVEFPLLIAGLSQKARASQAFPMLDRVRSYPTTLFLDGKNRVVAIHTGFRGPATGADHRKLRREFEERIEGLLGR